MKPKEIEKLFENAPEGATHCDRRYMEFYRPAKNRKGGQFYDLNRGGWKMLCDDFSSLIMEPHVIPRPSPAWSGEGLPPVGATIEWMDGETIRVEVVGYYKGAVVAVSIEDPGYVYIGKSADYRQIRTPEQIAADEREAAVAEMLDVVNTNYPNFRFTRQMAIMFFELGFRRLDTE